MERVLSFFLIFMLFACAPRYDEQPVVTYETAVCIKPHHSYHYQTCFPITVTIDRFIVTIPHDFDTDLASIPRWLWSIISPAKSEFIAPAILHDYLYTCHNGLNRKQIDNIFYASLLDNGVSEWRAYPMFIAVRLFGESHFSGKGSCQKRLLAMAQEYGDTHGSESYSIARL